MDTTNFDEAAELRARLAEVTAQRDELLAALEAIEKRCSSTEFLGIRAAKELRDTARAAIAAAKGEA